MLVVAIRKSPSYWNGYIRNGFISVNKRLGSSAKDFMWRIQQLCGRELELILTLVYFFLYKDDLNHYLTYHIFHSAHISLRFVSAIFTEFLFFHQMIALSPKKLFSFSRYSVFCISVLPSFSTCWPLLYRMIEDKS